MVRWFYLLILPSENIPIDNISAAVFTHGIKYHGGCIGASLIAHFHQISKHDFKTTQLLMDKY